MRHKQSWAYPRRTVAKANRFALIPPLRRKKCGSGQDDKKIANVELQRQAFQPVSGVIAAPWRLTGGKTGGFLAAGLPMRIRSCSGRDLRSALERVLYPKSGNNAAGARTLPH